MKLRVHPLTVVTAAAALWMGEGAHLLAMSVSLLLHELGHLAAARLCSIEVAELEILPLGGAIRLRGAWEMRPAQTAAAALAGPAVSLLSACAATLLRAPLWVNTNLLLCLFNLIPALPLDGGRALCVLLMTRMRLTKAVAAGVRAGYALSGLLILFFVRGAVSGVFNLTWPLAALYILLSGRREKLLAAASCVMSLRRREKELQKEGCLPMTFHVFPATATVREVVSRLPPRRVHVICPCGRDMAPMGFLTENALLPYLEKEGGKTLMELASSVRQWQNEWVSPDRNTSSHAR